MTSADVAGVNAEHLCRFVDLALDTPELVIDLDVVRRNIRRTADMAAAAGVDLRPHVKTHKIPQIARLQIEGGAVGIQVAKLGEAEIMAHAGLSDILVGYPIVGAAKLERLTALALRTTVTVSLDSYEVAQAISAAAHARGVHIRLLIELDTGLARLGATPRSPATTELAERIADLPATTLVGVLTHEGHVYAQASSADEMRTLTLTACEAVVDTLRDIKAAGICGATASVGSTGTFRFAIEAGGVTEVRPGTYIFNDRTQVALGSATGDDVAAAIVTTVVSSPRPGEVVVDAGSKALTSDRMLNHHPSAGFGVTADGSGIVTRLSEEHAVISFGDGVSPAIGERLVIVPNHICPVVNLFDEVTVADHGSAERWPVAARGRLQ
jgi:D-serine deaminase-like pyridoxal phosphate-dependent protein